MSESDRSGLKELSEKPAVYVAARSHNILLYLFVGRWHISRILTGGDSRDVQCMVGMQQPRCRWRQCRLGKGCGLHLAGCRPAHGVK